MHQGRLEQIGSPSDIYLAPATKFVAEFMGEANVFQVTRKGDTPDVYQAAELGAELRCVVNEGIDRGFLVVRPEYLRFVSGDDHSDNVLRGRIVNEYVLGSRIQYHVSVGGEVLTIERLAGESLPAGTGPDGDVHVAWDASSGRVVAT